MAITTLLTQYPLSGRMTSESGLRTITTSPYPFAIFYEVTDEEIIVIGIQYTAIRHRTPADASTPAEKRMEEMKSDQEEKPALGLRPRRFPDRRRKPRSLRGCCHQGRSAKPSSR
jgi:hypothetical protein